MKARFLILIGSFLLGISSAALAEVAQQASRSAGKFKHDQSVDLAARLRQLEPVVRAKPTADENYEAAATAQRFAGVANRHDQLFEIYNAEVQLLADLDGDGYHHALDVAFDVDVSYGSAALYAKLYLSREGEPWSQYFTTDLFHIHGEDASDVYQVETELVEGYPPGYYAVLVEIYSLDHAYMVTSEVLDYYYLGRDVTLEDQYWDEPPVAAHGGVSVAVHGHGGGSMAALLLFFLFIQVVIAARGH